MEQNTPEWHVARLGKVTASRMAELMAKTKSGPSASRANYMAELIVERLTGAKADHFVNAAMQWGTDQEPNARLAYEAKTGELVEQIGFVQHPEIDMAGCSPDGLVGDEGMIEIKCPNSATHIETCISQAIPKKYQSQMQWQMACTGRKWVDFVSYDPRMPEKLRLFIKRLDREPLIIKAMNHEVIDFLAEIEVAIVYLKSAMYWTMQAD